MGVYDFCVVGGGIVGLATAREFLRRRPGSRLLLLEKEGEVAFHQSGHNSGVIHAGIYYEPGSLKAKLCRAGLSETTRFCDEYHLPYEACGKLIVATNEAERLRLDALYERSRANGLSLERLNAVELGRVEPNIAGAAALLSRETGMVDYARICRKLAELVGSEGGVVRLNSQVAMIREEIDAVTIATSDEEWKAKRLIVCAGLQSDRLARLAGLPVDFRMVPFRGEYFRLPPSRNGIVKHHIYPAPDPALPFLGVHLTRMINGSVTVGPNAVLGMSREGYPKFSFDGCDVLDFMTFGGFWKLLVEQRRHAVAEAWSSLSRRAYLKLCQKYCPDLVISDLLPFRAGIRAQAVNKGGKALHDFLFLESERMLHVCNAPSPAATSALPIARMIADRVIAGR